MGIAGSAETSSRFANPGQAGSQRSVPTKPIPSETAQCKLAKQPKPFILFASFILFSRMPASTKRTAKRQAGRRRAIDGACADE